MKAITLTIVFILALSTFLPWWFFAFLLFAAGLMSTTLAKALRRGFVSSFLAWAGWPLLLHFTGSGALGPRLSVAFHLPWWPLIFVLSGLTGGLLGASSAWVGYSLKRLTTGSRP